MISYQTLRFLVNLRVSDQGWSLPYQMRFDNFFGIRFRIPINLSYVKSTHVVGLEVDEVEFEISLKVLIFADEHRAPAQTFFGSEGVPIV